MLCQTSMNLLKGIVIGTIHGLKFNKWQPNRVCEGMVWQLIAIFDKVNQFLVTRTGSKPFSGQDQ